MLSLPALSVRLLGASMLLKYVVIAHPAVELVQRDPPAPSLLDALQSECYQKPHFKHEPLD